MLTPHAADWELLQQIIRQRELRHPESFDIVQGWGHAIVPGHDAWETKTGTQGTNWTFGFAYSDQGLLYHWVKYVQKNVSIRLGNRLQHWTTTSPNGTLYLANTTIFDQNAFVPGQLLHKKDRYACLRWACDWTHFTSDSKPWLLGPPQSILHRLVQNNDTTATASGGGVVVANTPLELWFLTLHEIQREYPQPLNMDFSNWTLRGTRPPLGTWAGLAQVRAKTQRTNLNHRYGNNLVHETTRTTSSTFDVQTKTLSTSRLVTILMAFCLLILLLALLFMVVVMVAVPFLMRYARRRTRGKRKIMTRSSS